MNDNEDMMKFVLSTEVYEEMGIFPDRIIKLNFLGIFEDEYRLFVPDAFFIGITDLSYKNGEVERIYREFKDKIKEEVIRVKLLDSNIFWALKGREELKHVRISQNLRVYLEEQKIIRNSEFWS
jgi:hypothetical protein